MKTRLITALILLSAAFFTSCNKDDASGAKATFRKANISGAQMLALAQGSGTATKAEGDISVGPKALYSVSEDGTLVQVSYNVDVEGASHIQPSPTGKMKLGERISSALMVSATSPLAPSTSTLYETCTIVPSSDTE